MFENTFFCSLSIPHQKNRKRKKLFVCVRSPGCDAASHSRLTIQLDHELVPLGIENVLDEIESGQPLERAQQADLVLLEHQHQAVLDVLVEHTLADQNPVLVGARGLLLLLQLAELVRGLHVGGGQGALVERQLLALQVAFEEGARRDVVGDALRQMGHDGVARKVGLLPGDAQVAAQVSGDRGEDRLRRLVRVHQVRRLGVALRLLLLLLLQIGPLYVRERLLGHTDQLGCALLQPLVELVLLVQSIVCAIFKKM